ncbi:MAG: adenylate/guanylate cyclase domain-containing protein [Desulfobacteraceae bacterium]|nr:adenylate/guanylate cyclase domain-containing protein [Desulfobacteraceae bacterium]
METDKLIKSRFQYFHISNAVLIGNMIAIFIGDRLTRILFQHRAVDASETFLNRVYYLDIFYGAFCVVTIFIITVWYEKPIRHCLKSFYKGQTPDPVLLENARRRVLNEPHMIVILDMFIWGLGALLLRAVGSPAGGGVGIASGLITTTLAFFWVEYRSQYNLVPLFFPEGDLSTVKGVRNISLKLRFAALILAVSVVPLTFIHLTMYRFKQIQMTDAITPLMLVNRMEETIAKESILFIIIAIALSWLVAHHTRRPIVEIIRVMGYVKRGDFSKKAKVFSNDEIGFAGETLNAMTQGLRERELIKDIFGKYVDEKIRDEILRGRVPMNGELKEATILFADLRNFTPLVAVTPPKELIYVLNAYFHEMAQAIKENNGLILQFIGDEVEAVFGAPIHQPGHELAAIKTALAMRLRLEQLNKRLKNEGIDPIAHGVGIHTGSVLAANIGSTDRYAYSLIGDTVNLASRIQGLTKEFQTDILVSETIQSLLKDHYNFQAMPEIKVKGKSNPIRVFSLNHEA